MRSLVLGAVCALLASSAFACSSANFNTADPTGDDSGGDESGGDSSVGTDTRPDGRVDETRPAEGGDTSAAPDGTHDDGVPDSGKVDSTVGVDTAVDTGGGGGDGTVVDTGAVPDTIVVVDTCVKNACGGCAVLSAAPGDACGACGKYACSADGESLTCADTPKNVCGGCSSIPSGRPGDACCVGGALACSADKESLACSGGGNACGGCTALAHDKGSGCGGVCGSAVYQCVDKDTTSCVDPLASAPAPGTACGSCGTRACNATGTAVVCNDPGLNACGGCGTLAGAPGGTCGECGTFVCSADKASVTCNDPGRNACGGCGVLAGAPGSLCTGCGAYACDPSKSSVSCAPPPVAIGTVCGQCNTGSYVCSSPQVTVCSDPLPSPAVGSACNDCGNYACNAPSGATAIVCVGGDANVSRCSVAHYGCDVPQCSATGVCSYPASDALCASDACTVDTCTGTVSGGVKSNGCAASSSPPIADCDAPTSGCQRQLRDGDGDGYTPYRTCSIGRGIDCNDGDPGVHPGADFQTSPATKGATYVATLTSSGTADAQAPQWDYNCDGISQKQYNLVGKCKKNTTGGCDVILNGWWASGVVGCGVTGLLLTDCMFDGVNCISSTTSTVQPCR